MASTLKNNSEKFAQDVEAGKISRTQLLEFTCICQEASAFIERNSSRAADLIESFKKVSVDQTSERRRSFNLQQLVMDVVATHHNSWKRTTHQIDVDVPEELEIDGYPGALEQIISNLIENSLVHGFEGMEQGCVKIAAARDGELIHLVYSDTGHGIALQNLSKIFDPFFTTRLGKGGSGLGLYLVQQLLTNVLDGTIKVISEPERGCRFEIAFPVVIPGLVRQDRQDRA